RVTSLSPGSPRGYAVFGRDFASGTVFANPLSGTAAAINLGFPHVDLDGNILTSVVVGSQQSAILRGDRVGWWHLDTPASNSVPDSSAANVPGALNLGTVGHTSLAEASGPGHRASTTAYVFDGFDDYVNFGNPVVMNVGGGDYSISAWFKLNASLTASQT